MSTPTADTPRRWILDLERLLGIRSQFVVAGNIRDHFLIPLQDGQFIPVPLLRRLWVTLRAQGYSFLLVYDPVDGIRPYPAEKDVAAQAARLFELRLQDNGAMPMSLERLSDLMAQMSRQRELHCALVVDFASRLARSHDQLSAEEHRFFLAAEKLAVQSAPLMLKEGGIRPMFNPVIWLLNRAQDMPSWFVLDNARVETLHIGLPEREARTAAALSCLALFADAQNASDADRKGFAEAFAQATQGMPLTAISDIAQLARRFSIPWRDVDEAVQCFKVGVRDNPWKKPWLRHRIHNAAAGIEDRVKGQPQAITKTVDILMRSVMGLTGAQARSSGNRPRGVLFFAGPTGVGKTELAKALTQVLFGDERAYIRFDMSEFAEEHTGARLLGAPPGYVGFDAGGELTNAVREKPFSVVLFDEIEKAHPRILDKFLQILEDGRLTDGRGDTAYFSETVLIFTSNLGIYVEDPATGQRTTNVEPGEDYSVVESRIRAAIGDYFKYRLSRPEILNRIGDNIVVFNFIQPAVAIQIFDGMIANIRRRVASEHGLALLFAPDVLDAIRHDCTSDLSNGGRGIGNMLESRLINPLARALFAFDATGRDSVTVTRYSESAEKIISLELQ